MWFYFQHLTKWPKIFSLHLEMKLKYINFNIGLSNRVGKYNPQIEGKFKTSAITELKLQLSYEDYAGFSDQSSKEFTDLEVTQSDRLTVKFVF